MNGLVVPSERFRIVSSASFLRNCESVDSEPGIYGLFLRNAASVLLATGYSGAAPLSIGEFTHLYLGRSHELGKRIKHHLIGTMARSTFRQTLFAIDAFHGGAVRDMMGCDELTEESLTGWFMDNALVAYRCCEDPDEEERAQLRGGVASPLNISERPNTYSRRLIAIRSAMKGKPVPRCCWRDSKALFA